MGKPSVYDGMSQQQIESFRKYHREYYQKHKEEICKQRNENRKYNGDQIRQYEKEWRMKNKDKVSATQKRHYEKKKAQRAALEAENKALKEIIAILKQQKGE